MTTQSQIPTKWYVPFANGDSSRVEIPVTTSDPTRASQTLGFPPLTMQPPESGGVPPQGEDFNGGMNQIARVAWWVLNAGGWPFDASFATNSNIGGYPKGATVQGADFQGEWISLADSNTNNPDTGSGTAWVPGFQYGVTPLSALTGGTVTPTPAQAAKGSITLAGALTSALTVVLPAWLKNWTITNNTTGAFVTIVKTAAGSGVTIPQNSSPTRVSGDGTNIVQSAENVALATTSTQSVQFGQLSGVVGAARNAAVNIANASTSATFTADEIIVNSALGALQYRLGSYSQTINLSGTGAGGMDTGLAPLSGFVAVYAAYNPSLQTRTIFAQDVTSITAGEVYGGANAPAGFTATALIAVIPTDGSRQFVASFMQNRNVSIIARSALNTTTPQAALTLLSLTGVVPRNARRIYGLLSALSTTAPSSQVINTAAGVTSVAQQQYTGATVVAGNGSTCNFTMSLSVVQQMYYTAATSAGTTTFQILISAYDF